MINEKSYKCNEVMCLSLGPLMAGGEAMCYYFPVDPNIRVGVGKTIRAETESCKKKHFGIINVLKITTILSKPVFANHERASTP